MAVLTEVVEGWTGVLPFTLNADGSPVDLTGLTVSIVLKDRHYNSIKDTTEGVSVTASTGGTVSYAPATSSGDLFLAAKSPYYVRFRVVDALGGKVYFPNADEDIIKVNRV